jgi:gamma-glutamylcyclotransferase (GGCT)/AIG2-like uncharacterized protein YtfP
MADNKFYVFVYGTLKKGHRLHRYMDSADFVSESYIRGFKLYSIGWYPGIVETCDFHDVVYGEVYCVDSNTMKMLDKIEDVPEEYSRHFVQCQIDDEWVDAVTYHYNRQVREENLIASGMF